MNNISNAEKQPPHITHSSNFSQVIALQAQLSSILNIYNTSMAPIDTTLIPRDLPDNLKAVCRILLDVKHENEQDDIRPPVVIVITDLAKDYNDLLAMVLLKELHRLGLIKLRGFVTSRKTCRISLRRAGSAWTAFRSNCQGNSRISKGRRVRLLAHQGRRG